MATSSWRRSATACPLTPDLLDVSPSQLTQINTFLTTSKITQLSAWQKECLTTPDVLKNGANLVVSAPTSAGKSLISDVLLLRTLLKRKKKVILVLPYVATAQERVHFLRPLLQQLDFTIEDFVGGRYHPGGLASVDVAVCTIETANTMILRMIEHKSLSDIGLIIVDEFHMFADASRGYLIELLLTKLQYIKDYQASMEVPQLICMSASILNDSLSTFAHWLNAKLYDAREKGHPRPVELTEMIACDMNLAKVSRGSDLKWSPLFPSSLQNRNTTLECLTFSSILQGKSTLVFCHSKKNCENIAKRVSQLFESLINGAEDEFKVKSALTAIVNSSDLSKWREEFMKMSPENKQLYEYSKYGVAYHHASLAFEERSAIEEGFREKSIRILFSTTTLSSGLNLPAGRVIVESPMCYNNSLGHYSTMEVVTYKQMIGRAGRRGLVGQGESILVCSKRDLKYAKDLIKAGFPQIKSNLIEAKSAMYDIDLTEKFKLAILEMISTNILVNEETFFNYIMSTFYHAAIFKQRTFDSSQKSTLRKPIDQAYKRAREYFLEQKLIQDNDGALSATLLGEAISHSGLSIAHGLFIRDELEIANEQFCLKNNLHALYHTIPPMAAQNWWNINWNEYVNIFRKLNETDQTVARLIQINEVFIDKVKQIKEKDKYDKLKNFSDVQLVQLLKHQRFYGALALNELLNGKSLAEVENNFPGLTKGDLQTVKQYAPTFGRSMITFIDKYDSPSSLMGVILQKCIKRQESILPKTPINEREASDFTSKLKEKFYAGISSLYALPLNSNPSNETQGNLKRRQSARGNEFPNKRFANEQFDNYQMITVETPAQCDTFLKEIFLGSSEMIDIAIHFTEHPDGWKIEGSHGMFLKKVYFARSECTQIFCISSPSILKRLQTLLKLRITNLLKRNKKISFQTYNIKKTLFLLQFGFNLPFDILENHIAWYDVSVALWLLHTNANYGEIIEKMSVDQILSQLPEFPIETLHSIEENAKKAILVIPFSNHLNRELESQSLYQPYVQIEVPSRVILSQLQSNGILIDKQLLDETEQRVTECREKLLELIYREMGKTMTHGQTIVIPQISRFIVQTIGVEKLQNLNAKYQDVFVNHGTGFKLKNSRKETLEAAQKLMPNSIFPTMIIEYRKLKYALLSLLKSLKAALKLNQNQESIIYGNCNEFIATGRITMNDPNLIMVNRPFSISSLENEKKPFTFRSLFRARPGYLLVSADFSQLELRILAHFSEDTQLREAIDDTSVDVFKAIAAQLFKVKIEDVDETKRGNAKEIYYGINYGMGIKGLTSKLNSTKEEAKKIRSQFLNHFRGVRQFANKVKANCEVTGYVETLSGRKRPLPDISSEDMAKQRGAKRQAVNTTIQGTAADLLKVSMLSVNEMIQRTGLCASLILQMYDELMYEVKVDSGQRFACQLKIAMEKVANCLNVPLPVKVKMGPNWGQLEDVTF